MTRTIARGRRARGHAAEATALVAKIDAQLAEIRARVADAPRPRTLLVFGRELGALRGIYASGGVGFLHDMLEAAGGDDVFADIKRESVQATTELILARRPEVILEIRSGPAELGTLDAERALWKALASVPAVRNERVHFVVGSTHRGTGPARCGSHRACSRGRCTRRCSSSLQLPASSFPLPARRSRRGGGLESPWCTAVRSSWKREAGS